MTTNIVKKYKTDSIHKYFMNDALHICIINR